MGAPVERTDEVEAKLLQIPRGIAAMAAEARWFEEERGCPVVEVRVRAEEFLGVCRLMGEAGLVEIRVRVEKELRLGHVRLVGGIRS